MMYGCPSWCYGWDYPYQTSNSMSESLVAVTDKSHTKSASKDFLWYPHFPRECMMCDRMYGCPSWCYGWNYPYQASNAIPESLVAVADRADTKAAAKGKWWYPHYQRNCMMCDMMYGCPSWCYGWNYPYQATNSMSESLVAVTDKSDTKAASKGNWWYPHYRRECMMCDMMYGCPSWCYGWNYPYQAWSTIKLDWAELLVLIIHRPVMWYLVSSL